MGHAALTKVGGLFAILLIGLLVLPIMALTLSSSVNDIEAGVAHPMFVPALTLSLKTTCISLLITTTLGSPLAWWLASSRSSWASVVSVLVDIPIVLPPAVIGVALLQTFGRQGLLGPTLEAMDISMPFTAKAVVMAQVVVAAPFFVQAATSAFRRVDADTLLVARTLGMSSIGAFFRVALPMAAPGLLVGASLAWARALGEFGATLVFAGNMTGKTQTMPLAIFYALESDVQVAIVFSLLLAAVGGLLLVGLRLVPVLWRRRPSVRHA